MEYVQMLFVYNFCSHLKYYNITHNIPDLVFKSNSLFNMNQANACLFKVNNQNKIGNIFTVNNKDTRTTRLISLILNIVNIDILNAHYSCAGVR